MPPVSITEAKIAPVERPAPTPQRRLGFLAGQFAVPDDFDRMGEQEIQALFEGNTPSETSP